MYSSELKIADGASDSENHLHSYIGQYYTVAIANQHYSVIISVSLILAKFDRSYKDCRCRKINQISF